MEYCIGELTTQEVYDGLTSGGKTAGGMDGWQPAELALVSWNTCVWIKEFFKMIEAGRPWPKSCLHAMVRYLEKDGSKVGEAMSFRPLYHHRAHLQEMGGDKAQINGRMD